MIVLTREGISFFGKFRMKRGKPCPKYLPYKHMRVKSHLI